MRKSKKYCWGILAIILVVFISAVAISLIWDRDGKLSEEMKLKIEADSRIVQEFVENVGTNGAESMMLSMYPIDTYNEEVFLIYIPEQADILKVPLDSGNQLAQVLETILEKPHTLKKVYLGIHKEGLKAEGAYGLNLSYRSGFFKTGMSWEEKILALAKEHPEIEFRMTLYYPKISMLTAMSEEQVEALSDWYVDTVNLLLGSEECRNIQIYMPGAEEWLIANEGNYQDDYNLKPDVANELETLALCVCWYQVYPENIIEKVEQLNTIIHKYIQKPITPIGQEDYTYVFFGDSVIGNYSGSMSIPGVVSYMTGATAINCGYGGLSATKPSKEGQGLKDVLDVLLAEEGKADVTVLGNENVQKGILEFWGADIPKDSDKLKFFIMFGINDYLCSHPVENEAMDAGSFRGALTYAVDVLQESYPNAEVILMTPNKVAFSEFGTLPYIEGGHVYREYVDTVYKVAEEKKVRLIDIHNELGITEENYEEYIPDMCHLGHYGRFKLGEVIQKNMISWENNG